MSHLLAASAAAAATLVVVVIPVVVVWCRQLKEAIIELKRNSSDLEWIGSIRDLTNFKCESCCFCQLQVHLAGSSPIRPDWISLQLQRPQATSIVGT